MEVTFRILVQLYKGFLQDFSGLERDEGRGWILWGLGGFVAGDTHTGLDLLNLADPPVRASLQFREKFSRRAKLKYSQSLKKVSCCSDILIFFIN